MPSASRKVDFATFFCIWAEDRRWAVPDIHWRAVEWLEKRQRLAVLRCFRGFGKSTLLAVYNAWRYYDDPSYRILHQGDQDRTAYKTSRDTRAVLQRHPLTRDDPTLGLRGEQSFWWVAGSDDERNPSMQAAGITSNITSSRCDEAQNDDVEVPRNIQNPEAREKMRYRLGEQTHCMVPGARQLYIGTPHTHDSLYDEVEQMGADCLTIAMFEKEHRIERATGTAYKVPFEPEMVFAGIGRTARLLRPGVDYLSADGHVKFKAAPGVLVDFYAGSAWPERFTPDEMITRRQKCKTTNEWDSQYQLHSRPLHEMRLDPDTVPIYDAEPRFERANKVLMLMLGKARIVGATLRWDPSSAKTHSDVSALALMFQDEIGRRYWHRSMRLEGQVAEMNETATQVIGGQVFAICDVVERFGIRRIVVETNGVGAFAPVVLRMALKQRRLACTVQEETALTNKNRRILEAFEGPMTSKMLWAHTSVADGPAFEQMKSWNPAMTNQADDYLDAAAGAVTDQPERVGQLVRKLTADEPEDWRPSSGVYEAELEI